MMEEKIEFWKQVIEHRSIQMGYGWQADWVFVHNEDGVIFILGNPPKVMRTEGGYWLPNIYADFENGELVSAREGDHLNFTYSFPMPKVTIQHNALVVRMDPNGAVWDGGLYDPYWQRRVNKGLSHEFYGLEKLISMGL